jgi:hypothetical protein
MVSVISIFEAFEFVSSIIAFDYVTFAWTLCNVSLFLLGGLLDESSCHSQPYLSLSTLHPLISLPFGIFEYIDLRRDCPSFHGKKGLKA